MSGSNLDVARLVISCPDRPGIVAAVAGRLTGAGANIISSFQFSTDPEHGTFFMRTEFHLENLADRLEELDGSITELDEEFQINHRLCMAARPQRVAIFTSRYEHCLLDLLWRWKRGELPVDVACVISNHPDLSGEVEPFGVDYIHIPVTPETKSQAEARQLEVLAGQVDLVVLARYMQILSPNFLERVRAPVINIHHSFLPAFAGPNPYDRAHERGVKLIGATAHYATEDLDEGPIIEQDVARVSHRHDARLLERVGRDIERMVLAKAVTWHVEDRVMVHENRTIVFL